MKPVRQTIITQSRLAVRTHQLAAARAGRQGVQVTGIEQFAARLAGGFSRPVDGDDLKLTIRQVLPGVELGELTDIRSLPGMAGTAASTLRRAWLAGINLQARAADHPRIQALANLETAALAGLPSGMLPPPELVRRALNRARHAPAISGVIDVHGITDFHPVWRPLLTRLAELTQVSWHAAAGQAPAWLAGTAVQVTESPELTPTVSTVSAGTATNEIQEALRWARQLLSQGVDAGDIAIASTATAEYDTNMYTASRSADFPVHFGHGIPVTATAAGQEAAALADLLARGVTRIRLQRLLRHTGARLFKELPPDWSEQLPEYPLDSPENWQRFIQAFTLAEPELSLVSQAAQLLTGGTAAAEAAGEQFLTGDALAIWRRVLLRGPAAAIDQTITYLHVQDEFEATSTVTWLPASTLQAAPRPYTRLLGLNSSRWPRRTAEDPLLPDHVIASTELDPLPHSMLDRLHFAAIRTNTAKELVISWSRRSAEGRLLARSPLAPARPEPAWTNRHDTPVHAYSHADRLLARPADFAASEHATATADKWTAWNQFSLNRHDGLLPENHPVIRRIIDRRHSATSLRMLLRHPLAYVWRYGLHVSEPEVSSSELLLDNLEYGNLVHEMAQRVTHQLESSGGLLNSSPAEIGESLAAVAAQLAADWQTGHSLPPRLLFERQVEEARRSLEQLFTAESADYRGGNAYAEVPFGGYEAQHTGDLPWDGLADVFVPGTSIRLSGFIDHMNISADGKRIQVLDYKTGTGPARPHEYVLEGGRELQRTIYTSAVKSMLGHEIQVDAALAFTRTGTVLSLPDSDTALSMLTDYLQAGITSLLNGNALPGDDAREDWHELRIALPASRNRYLKRKEQAIAERLPVHTELWNQP